MTVNRARKWSFTHKDTRSREEIISGTLSPILIAQSRASWLYMLPVTTTTTTTTLRHSQYHCTYAICVSASIFLSIIHFYLAHLIESHLSCLHSLTHTHAFIIISRCGDKIPRKMENFHLENENKKRRAQPTRANHTMKNQFLWRDSNMRE